MTKRARWLWVVTTLTLGCSGPVSPPASDSGTDAGTDAGHDAGHDAGSDGGVDAGAPDGGTDAGEDAGLDGGEDAGEDAGVPVVRCPPRVGAEPGVAVVRVVAANLTSGNGQSYDPGHGGRILQGLAPDVVLIQEFNFGDKSDRARRVMVDTYFGEEFCFHVEANAQIPNGVISRYPILDAGEWFDPIPGNRDFAWAQIDVPGSKDLWAVSVHLITSPSSDRAAETQNLMGKIADNIPAGDYVVIGGDFNTTSRTETSVNNLSSMFKVSGPHPVDQGNNDNTNRNRTSPYDWVVANFALAGKQVPALIGTTTFDAGLVFDSRQYNPLSDVPGVQRNDSDAGMMQHMAVVKDFLLP